MTRCRSQAVGAVGAAVVVAGCRGVQSTLDPAGPQAARIERLWWFLLIVATVVFVLVLGATLMALMHRGRAVGAPASDARRERRLHTVIVVATAATVVTLFVFLVVNVSTER